MNIQMSLLFALLISFLSGCVTKDSILPKPEQDMAAVYSQHMRSTNTTLKQTRSVLRRAMHESEYNPSQYVRTEATQLQSRFKSIPNPKMYMYVAPHLSTQQQVPVPGYLTEFKMWETEHYALPGELSDMNPRFRGDQ